MNKTIKVFVLLFILIGSFPFANVQAETNDETIVVSMGDSYSSGEGIEPFYGQNDSPENKVKNLDWLSHRSENSWPGKLVVNNKKMADGKDEYWYFVATSGAETKHMKKPIIKKYNYEGKKSSAIIPAQLEVFDKLDKVDYVTITIGGNDVEFGGIIKSCFFGINEASLNHVSNKIQKIKFDYNYTGIKQDIINAYLDIIFKTNHEADVLVGGYPLLFDIEGLTATHLYGNREKTNAKGLFSTVGYYIFISAEEAKVINDGVAWFNLELNNLVKELQKYRESIHFVSVEEAFNGHGAYSQNEPFILPVIMGHESEDIKQSFITLKSDYSMHPNQSGANAYAACFQKTINEIEERKITTYDSSNLSNNPSATDSEINALSLAYKGIVIEPKDVVIKMYDSLQKGQYERAASCLDPVTEKRIILVGGIVSSLGNLLTGEYMSWGQIFLESYGAIDVTLIECETINMVYDSSFEWLSKRIPRIPLLNNYLCTSAYVRAKYRYKFNGEYKIMEEILLVERYGVKGWRISV